MIKKLILASTLTLAASSALAAGHASKSGFALANEGSTLVVMKDVASPADVQTFDLAEPLSAIAYRPVTGDLLGFKNGKIVTIDPATGAITDLAATFADDAMIADDAMVAFDFNNAIDAVRAVSSNGDNLVYFPEGFGDNDERAGSVRRFTDAFYADGDTNAGAKPMIFANAYTNAIAGEKATSTFQYAIDAGTDALVSLANNAGTLETVGALTIGGEAVDIAPMGGFDIISAQEGSDEAYAVLQIEGANNAGFYSIDLTNGAATLLADLPMGGFTGFAVAPAM